MKKAADAFRSIGEVSQLIGVAPHVLRYWETQFPLFSPVKRRDGRRYYRPDDIRLAAGLCEILREEGVSIRGAKKQMAADRGAALKARGAARLGGDYAEKSEMPPIKTPSAPPPPAAEVTAKAPPTAPEPAIEAATEAPRPARRRKAPEMAETLPLFPELDLFSAPAAKPAAAKPAARPAHKSAKAVKLDWLPRLTAINAGLQTVSILPRSEAEAALARLTEARRILTV